MNLPKESCENDYDRIVRSDIEAFREKAEDYLAGRLTDDEFRPFRLRRGIYGQRQPRVHMVRTKIPGGLLTAGQMRQLARIADEFAAGRAHLTTRQNVQFHFVPLRRVADLLHMLADHRMTTREACYNTVRNITCDPMAGLAADEVFDVRPYAQRLALAFLHNELTDNLPRKFKIAFSGREHDAAACAIHDIGLRAVIREGRRGFLMLVAGGLGPLPCEARVLDEFVPEERLVARCEAVIRVFARHGNRKNKNLARLKFVLRERGFEWLKDAVEAEYRDILENGGIPVPEVIPEGFGGFLTSPPPPASGASLPVLRNSPPDPAFDEWIGTNVAGQKQPGYAVVTAKVGQGNLTADQMRAAADLAEHAGDGYLRLTIEQNLSIAFVRRENLRRAYAVLKFAGLADSGAGGITDITTCPGAYSCNLALTKTMNLGEALEETVRDYADPLVRRLKIKASGCPNSCGQHWIGDIGFYGNSRRIEGREIPYYQMLLGGGHGRDGVLRFGLQAQSVPARLAPEALRRVLDHYIANRAGEESFRDYVLRHRIETFRALTNDLARPAELEPEIYCDWGDEVAFSRQLGRGECAS